MAKENKKKKKKIYKKPAFKVEEVFEKTSLSCGKNGSGCFSGPSYS